MHDIQHGLRRRLRFEAPEARCVSAPRGGQAMILAVLAIGGTLLAATVVAGFLMVYQIRQSTEVMSSAQSIAAADAGAEWALSQYTSSTPPQALCESSQSCARLSFTSAGPNVGGGADSFSNGAAFEVSCFDAAGNAINTCRNASSVQSTGSSAQSSRILGIDLTGIAAPGPTPSPAPVPSPAPGQ